MAQIGWTTTAGPPPDTLGAQGDMNWDPQGRFYWGPKGASSWAGTANGFGGQVGPAGPVGTQSPMSGLASGWSSAVQFAGQTMGTVAGAPAAAFLLPGTNIPNTFSPQYNTALTGLAVTNYSATGATVYFYLQDLTTGQAVFGFNGGNGISNNAGGAYSYGTTAYPLLAGHTYQWQGIRGSAGATFCQIVPTYLVPAQNQSSLTTFPQFLVTTSATVAKTGTIATTAAGLGAQTQYYRNGAPTWLYSIEANISGSGVNDIYLTNLSASNANQFTQDNYGYSTLSSTPTRFFFGPFAPQTWPFGAGSTYTVNNYAPSGSLTITQASIILTIGQ